MGVKRRALDVRWLVEPMSATGAGNSLVEVEIAEGSKLIWHLWLNNRRKDTRLCPEYFR